MLWVLFALLSQSFATPIVLMHGIASDATQMNGVEQWLRESLNVTSPIIQMEIGNGIKDSLDLPMKTQVNILCETIYSIPELENGFTFIGISQGGLLARGYVEMCNKFPVKNLITWGTPHEGVYGIGIFLDLGVDIYSDYAQDHFSFAGYWKDMSRYNTYLEKASYLPYLNNEIEHEDSDQYKSNMMSLQNFVMVWSKIDSVIRPSQSCKFEFFSSFLRSKQFTENLIGLQTLFLEDRLSVYEVPCFHMSYKSKCLNKLIDYTLPYV